VQNNFTTICGSVKGVNLLTEPVGGFSVKKINTADLIKFLSNYHFYDWDLQQKNKCVMNFGMSQDILQSHNIPEYYDSWGYEAINNKYAPIEFSVSQWLQLENSFFNWLSQAESILMHNIIVTPRLSNIWTKYSSYQQNWSKKNIWEKDDYDLYLNTLEAAKIINLRKPQFNLDCRGAVIENFNELKILGKMATRNFDLIFFSNNNMVFRITEYLTLQLELKDQITYSNVQQNLLELLNPIELPMSST